MLNTMISQRKNQQTLTMKMKLLKTKMMMKVKMKILMKMTPMRILPEVDVVAVAEAGDLGGDLVQEGEGDADAQLVKEQEHHSLTKDAEDVVNSTEEPGAIRNHFRLVHLLMSKGQVITAHSPQSQLLMIDMVHRPVLVVIYDVDVEQPVARENEARSLGVVSNISRNHNMMMKMNLVHTNPSLNADLAEDVVRKDVDAIQPRPETTIR